MISNEKVKKNSKRLETLKKLTLEKYLDEIDDLNSEILLYDVMFHHLVKGDFADDYEFSALGGVKKEEKKEVMNLVKKYDDLCFYNGSVDFWSDSTETANISDYDFISYNLLDNYEFLMNLAKDGGEDVLDDLEKLKSVEGFNDSSVIEYLRNTFNNDEILFKTVLNMSSKQSLFKVFTDEQKALLLKYPEGVLYFYDKDAIRLVSPLFLAVEACNRMGQEVSIQDREDIERAALDVTQKLRDADIVEFGEVISDMSDDYIDNIEDHMALNGRLKSLPVLSDDGSISKKIWKKEERDRQK